MSSLETMAEDSGVAGIKPEYIDLNHKRRLAEEFLPKEIVQDFQNEAGSAKCDPENSSTKSRKSKFKGRNKKRPIEKKPDSKDKMCPQILAQIECKFGDNCRFIHDVEKFVALKPPDLGDRCYNYETFGKCAYSYACRFGSGHLTSDNENKINAELYERRKDDKTVFNALERDLQRQLWKRRYDFTDCDVVWKNAKMELEGRRQAPKKIKIDDGSSIVNGSSVAASANDSELMSADQPSVTGDLPPAISDTSGMTCEQTHPTGDSLTASSSQQTTNKSEQNTGDQRDVKCDRSSMTCDGGNIDQQDASSKNEQDVTNDQSTVICDQPSVTCDQPSVTSDQPSVTCDQPSMTSDQPSVSSGQPSVSSDQPSVSSDQPSVSSDQPSVTCDQPSVTCDQPTVTSELPVFSLKGRDADKKYISFKDKLYLAPLTTLGNLPFRRVCKGLGVDITCGEMVMCPNILQGQQSEWALLKRHTSEDCFGIQLCGSYADVMTRCAHLICNNLQADFIDINCGCPIDLVFKKGEGSALMGRASRLQHIVKSMTSVMNIPLTVKMRTGIYEAKSTAHNLLPSLRDWGVSMVTIHGRSREQRYTRLANWEYIDVCAKAASPMPIYGNGDILSYEDYEWNRLHTGVSGAMVARGALIKPWIFTEIKERRHWDISANERLDVLRDFTNFGLEHWGSDQQGVTTTRRFLLEWLSFLYRYIPVGLLERLPQKINQKPPYYFGRNDLEMLMASPNCYDWIKISEMLLGPVPSGFVFLPKHKANAYR